MDDLLRRLDALTEARRTTVPAKKPRAVKSKQERDAVKQGRDAWGSRALEAVKRLKNGALFTSGDIAEYMGDDKPRFANAWGGVFRVLTIQKLAVSTGETRRSTDPAARGRMLQVWRRI